MLVLRFSDVQYNSGSCVCEMRAVNNRNISIIFVVIYFIIMRQDASLHQLLDLLQAVMLSFLFSLDRCKRFFFYSFIILLDPAVPTMSKHFGGSGEEKLHF